MGSITCMQDKENTELSGNGKAIKSPCLDFKLESAISTGPVVMKVYWNKRRNQS